MASIREQILAGIAQALGYGGGLPYPTPANGNVYRSRAQLITRSGAPAIVVRPADEGSREFGDQDERNDFMVDVEIHVRGDVWDTLADQVAVPAHQAIWAWALGADYVSRLRRAGATFKEQEADSTAGVLVQRYRVIYLTRAADISAATP